MKLPHGIHDFQELVSRGFYYIDRTPYIEKLERSTDRLVLFQRPQNFDRKLFISMLSYYYGIQYKARFNSLFKHYYIGKNRTAQANRYHILKFDLSNLNPGSLQYLEQSLMHTTVQGIELFLDQYGSQFPGDRDLILFNDRFEDILTGFLRHCTRYRIYLFLDDARGLISDIIDPGSGTTSFNPVAQSLINRFFSINRKGISDGPINRILVLGVDESADR